MKILLNFYLSDWKNGDKEALDKLIPLVYNELYKIASNRLSQERSDHTLQATALVNKAYLRLAKWDSADWQNRTHFFAVAAQVIDIIGNKEMSNLSAYKSTSKIL